MTKQCPFCIEARTEAVKQVYKWLAGTVFISQRGALFE